ncbi:MAG: DMT family transporter [Pseudonocardiaceae bacterium]
MDRLAPAQDRATTSDSATARADQLRVAAAGVLWGTGGPAGALLASSATASALSVACHRLLVGGALLLALLAATGRLRAVARDAAALRRLVLIGGLAALYQSCYFTAVALSSVSLATLVTLGSAPVLVLAADAMLTRRRPGAIVLTAAASAIGGLGLLIGSPGSGRAPLTGALLALGAAAGFAAITLLGRRQLAGLDPVSTTACGFTLGGLMLAVAVTTGAPGGLGFEITMAALMLVIYLGLVPTALAYVLYFGGLRTVRPGPAALLALLEPLTAAVLGAVLLGDRLGLPGLAGALLIIVAVLLCLRK